jgi:hypothetical protein
MGCWNGTCGISQLPILAGQRVWAFLIGVAGYNDSCGPSGHCYSTDLGFPMTMPIRGRYNDYGGIEDIEENYNTEIILSTFLNKERNRFPDVYSLINGCIERDSYVYSVDDKEYIKDFPVGLFMVLEEVAQSFKGARTSYEKYDGRHPRKDMRKDAKYFIEYLSKELPRIDKEYADDKGYREFKIRHAFEPRNEDCKKVGGYDNSFAIIFNNRGYAGSPIFDAWVPYREYIRNLAKQENINNEFDELITDACDFNLVSRALDLMRKSWVPQAGKGGQGEHLEFYWKLTTAMRRIIKRRLVELDKWNEEQ